jgi:hypothetical protein
MTNELWSADLVEPAPVQFFHSMIFQPASAEKGLRIESLVAAWLLG